MVTRSQTIVDRLTVDSYEPEGRTKARLLLVHGAWVGGWIWSDGFADYLADAGYASYAPTLRGRYDSKPAEDLGKVSVMDFVDDVIAAARGVGAEVLLGESAGGLFVQKAAETLEPRAMVLMNPAPPFMVPANPALLVRQIRYLPDLVMGRGNQPSEADFKALILNNLPEPQASEFYQRICAESGRALREISLGRVRVDSSKVRCPVYMVVGHRDVILPLRVHRKTARIYRAEVAEYPTMSHHTFSEEGWEKVASELVAWLDSRIAPK